MLPNTKAVYVETLTNPLVQVADLEAASLGPELYLSLAKYGLAAVLGLLLIFFGVRPLVRWLTAMGHVTTVTEPMSVAEMRSASVEASVMTVPQ